MTHPAEPLKTESESSARGARDAGSSFPPPEPWNRRRDGRALAALFLIVWVVFLLTASYTQSQTNDTRETAMSAWSLGTRGTLALPEEWDRYPEALWWDTEGRDGNTYTDRFPGTVLWAAPFYAVTEWVSPRGVPSHPWLLNYAPAGVAAATVSALAVCAWFLVYRRLAGRALALGSAGTLAFATGMWSVAATALWTHGPGALLLALGVLAMSSQRYASSGAAFGLSLLVRPQLAVVPAVMGLWEGARRRSVHPVAVVGSVSALGLGMMSTYSKVLFDTWLPIAGYGSAKVTSVATTGGAEFGERLALFLTHPQRGLFIYTPILLVLLPGLVRAWRAAPSWTRSAAIAGVVYLVVQLRANNWHGGGDYFGNRLGLEALALASPLLLLAFRRFVLQQRLIQGLMALLLAGSVILHGLGATVERSGFGGFDGATGWPKLFEELCADEPHLCEDLDVDDR